MSVCKELKPTESKSLQNRGAMLLNRQRPLKVQVLEGTVYLTREGDATDYIVREGEDLCIKDHGLVVIQGFPTAEFRVSA